VRQARPPVVVVPDKNAALTGREALVLERTGAVRLLRIEANRDDVQVVPVGKLVEEAAVRTGHRHQDRVLVEGLQAVYVDRAKRRGARQLSGDDAPEREDDIVGSQRLAVMEGDVRTKPDHPLRRGAVRADVLGKNEFGLRLGVQLKQRLVQALSSRSVQVSQPIMRIEGVRAWAASEAYLQVATPSRGTDRRRRGRSASRARTAGRARVE